MYYFSNTCKIRVSTTAGINKIVVWSVLELNAWTGQIHLSKFLIISDNVAQEAY